MANSSALGVLALVVVASMGAGAIVGLHLGSAFTPDTSGGGGTTSPPEVTTSAAGTPTPTDTPTPTAESALAANQFDRRETRDHAQAFVDGFREK